MKFKQKLVRRILNWRWVQLIAILVVCYLSIALIFFGLFVLTESSFNLSLESFVDTLLIMVSVSPRPEFQIIGKALHFLQAFTSIVLFGVFTALFYTKLNHPRNTTYLVDRLAFNFDDGKKHIPVRSSQYLFEFRLVVHPNPPLINPQIQVTFLFVNEAGERELQPLTLTPLQALSVRYYLVFRAIFPKKFLVKKVTNSGFLKWSKTCYQLPKGMLQVHVSGVDSSCDLSLSIYREYRVPDSAELGIFVDAIMTDSTGNIQKLDEAKLTKIKKMDIPNVVQ